MEKYKEKERQMKEDQEKQASIERDGSPQYAKTMQKESSPEGSRFTRNAGFPNYDSRVSLASTSHQKIRLTVNRNNVMTAMPSKRSIPTTASAKFTNPYLSKDAQMPLARGNISSQRSLERPETSASSMARLRPVSRPQAMPPSDSKVGMKGSLLSKNPNQYSDLVGG